MKRKLIRQGAGGFTFYVPKKWVIEQGLSAGDEIDLIQEGAELTISSTQLPQKKIKKFKIRDNEEILVKNEILNFYRQGFDVIELEAETKQQIKLVQKITDKFLLGFEVTEKTENKITIESVTEPSIEKQETIFRRIFLITKETLELAKEDMILGEFKNVNQLKELTSKIIQYSYFCSRNLRKKKYEQKKTYSYYVAYDSFKLITRSIYAMYLRYYEIKKAKVNPQIIQLVEELQNSFQKTYEGFFSKNTEKLFESREDMIVMYRKIKELIVKTKNLDTLALFYLGEVERMLYHLNSVLIAILT
ncbi:hypothetical protein HN587_03085 [Candidatus Woesearchaeota archaeon]|jgi:hypothetical protein|nr:hypothetical protein [Candidatus Woesearchaeota archaeon]